MSTQTVKICDVLDCGQLATETVDYMTVGNFNINQKRQDRSDGFHLWTEKNVDLCVIHDHEFTNSVPRLKLVQMLPVINKDK